MECGVPEQHVLSYIFFAHYTTMKKRTIQTASDVERSIQGYFPKQCSVQVTMCGSFADAIISYTDFKPVSAVINELSKSHPLLRISEIHREYSEDARMAVMRKLIDEDIEIFLPYDDGSLRPLNIGEIIEERLFNEEIG